jgi:quercetin dioxygenase-like cupin family protein
MRGLLARGRTSVTWADGSSATRAPAHARVGRERYRLRSLDSRPVADDHFARARAIADAHPIGPDEPLSITFVHHAERSSTAVVSFRAGGGVRPHIHRDHDEILVLIDGAAEIRVADDSQPRRAGDVVSVPAGTVHGLTASADGCLVVSVFAPWFDPDHPDRHFVEV